MITPKPEQSGDGKPRVPQLHSGIAGLPGEAIKSWAARKRRLSFFVLAFWKKGVTKWKFMEVLIIGIFTNPVLAR